MEVPKNLLSFEGISCISFNKDFSQCVISKKDKYLYIFDILSFNDIKDWKLVHTLKSVRKNKKINIIIFIKKAF